MGRFIWKIIKNISPFYVLPQLKIRMENSMQMRNLKKKNHSAFCIANASCLYHLYFTVDIHVLVWGCRD